MGYMKKLAALDAVLRKAPVTPPTPAEIQAKIALRASLQGHAGRVGHAVGVCRA